MSIKIIVSNKVGFTVKGEVNDENGQSQPFEFKLTARRFDEEEMAITQAALLVGIGKVGNHQPIVNLLCGSDADDTEAKPALITNWSGVKDEDNAELAFNSERLRQLIKANRGLAGLIWRTYQAEAGAKEKN